MVYVGRKLPAYLRWRKEECIRRAEREGKFAFSLWNDGGTWNGTIEVDGEPDGQVLSGGTVRLIGKRGFRGVWFPVGH